VPKTVTQLVHYLVNEPRNLGVQIDFIIGVRTVMHKSYKLVDKDSRWRRFVVPKAKVNDIQMYYEVKGEGFPVVMIMGLGGTLDWWDPRLIEGLSENFKTVMFDNRGAGRTDLSNKEYTIRLFADDTAGLMDALKISKAHICGYSMGGMIAQELAINYPEKVERLVLCSTNCGRTRSIPASQETLNSFMRAGSAPSAEERARMFLPLGCTEDFINHNAEGIELMIQRMVKAPTSPEAFQRQGGAIMSFDAYDRLARIKAPTLVLCGKRDILVPPENGPILAKAITNAKLVYLEKSAHRLAEEMGEAVRTVTEFLLA
jgi:pimeloyl-ACP methyl ester carboxylesterase